MDLGLVAAAVFGVPLAVAGYIVVAELALRSLARNVASAVRPWLWVGPALVFVLVYLVYPTLRTIWLSVRDANDTTFIGVTNYTDLLSDRTVQIAIRDNVMWFVFFTLGVLGLGLALAILADRVRYESVAKSLIFLPMAVSFTAAAVIWKFMYAYQPPGAEQTGTLNAIVTTFGLQPHAWLIEELVNNFALIAVGVWVWTGFALVILSASLKGIPAELMEAARVDGASELQVFRNVTLPLLMPTIVVISTTLMIFALKAFDVVYVMTNGNYDTDVLANRMYKELFNAFSTGRAATLAVLLLVATLPVVFVNTRYRSEEKAAV